MSYPPENVITDDPALARMRRRYADVRSDIARLKAESQRLEKEIEDRKRTLECTLGYVRGAAVELDLISSWLCIADPEFPATPQTALP